MTTSAGPSIKVEGGRVEGLDEALAQMKALGIEEGRKAGYAAGRRDAGLILNHEAAKGREAFASKLAADADISAEKAASLLAEVPVAQAPDAALDKLMKANNPNLGVGDATPEDGKSARFAELTAAAKAINSSRRA